MKRIYMTMALVASLGTAAFAQKQVDLGIKLLSPVGQQANLGASDTLRISFELTNNGPDAIDQTDTMYVVVKTLVLGTDIYSALPIIYNLGTPQMNIPAGGKDTLTWTLPNGEQFLQDGTSISVPTDAKVCEKIAVWGFDGTDGYFFVDNGFDVQLFSQGVQNDDADAIWSAFSGNSVDEETVTYGSGATDLCSGLGVKDITTGNVGMTVYPNPANANNVNLDFTLNKATATTGVQITDVTGRVVYTQELGKLAQGEHYVRLDISALNAGLYFVRLNAAGERGVTKLTVTK